MAPNRESRPGFPRFSSRRLRKVGLWSSSSSANLVLVWLFFSKLRLLRLTWTSGGLAGLIGIFILAVFAALLNSLTPTGSIVVGSRVVEVPPNVSGQIISIPIEPNAPVRAGSVLFQIDPEPFRYKVRQLEAALVAAQHQTEVLQANLD